MLDVDPMVASRRKPDHDPSVLRAKSSVAATLSAHAGRPDPRIRAIDANRPFALVLADVKTELWHAL